VVLEKGDTTSFLKKRHPFLRKKVAVGVKEVTLRGRGAKKGFGLPQEGVSSKANHTVCERYKKKKKRP